MASSFASVSKEEILKINMEECLMATFYPFLFFLMVSLVLAHEVDCRRLVVKLGFTQILKIF